MTMGVQTFARACCVYNASQSLRTSKGADLAHDKLLARPYCCFSVIVDYETLDCQSRNAMTVQFLCHTARPFTSLAARLVLQLF